MAKDLQQMKQRAPQAVRQRGPGSFALRAVLVGLGIALALVVIEGLAWIINPLSIFGATAHALPALISLLAHTPLLPVILLLEGVAVVALALLFSRPLLLRRYCRDAWQAGEQYRAAHTSLPNWPSLYETTVSYYQYTPDPAIPQVTRERSLLDLV